jgi:hypothetical protein
VKQLPDLARDGILTKSFWSQVKSIINANFREVALQPGVGYTVTNSPGGASLSIKTGSSGSASAAFPFQCTLVPQTNQDGSLAGNKVAVEYNSTLFTSLVPLVELPEITGLFNPDPQSSNYPVYLDLDGPDDTTNYVSPDGVPDDHVWLEIHFNPTDNSISASIETKGNGGQIELSSDQRPVPDQIPSSWASHGLLEEQITSNNNTSSPALTKQIYARIVLADYIDGGLDQKVKTDLVLMNMVIDGKPAIYPFRK